MFELLILHDKVLSSAKRLKLKNEFEFRKSLMKIKKISGPKNNPCGTPFVIGRKSD